MSETNIEIGCGFSTGADSYAAGTEAVRKAVAGITECKASLVIVFASVRYNLEELLRGIREVVESVPILGTTGAGEICNGVRVGSVVVVVLASPYIRVTAGVGERVSVNWEDAVRQALGAPDLMPYFGSDTTAVHKRLTLEGKQAFGLLFCPGNTRFSDSRGFEILEKLKELSQNRLPIFGGCSGDDWRMEENFVFHGERVYRDSLLLAVFETSLEWGMALYHGFEPLPGQVVITGAEGHEIRELNGEPAAEVFAALLGKSAKELEGKHLTLSSGLPIGVPGPYGQYSISVASYLTAGGGIRVSQPISRRTALTLMESEPDNLVAAGGEAFRKALLRGNVENPAAVIVFPCALQQKLLGERTAEQIATIRRMAPGVPVVGFYSLGEQGLADDGTNRHNNGVITTLVIGKSLSYAARVAAERKKAEQSLLEERLQFQQRLQHVEKSESLARMGGAIAHNFNNMLAIVMGNLELAMYDLIPDSRARARVGKAVKACERAVDLSRLMLTYLGHDIEARSPLDLAEACLNNVDMLQALVPGNVRLQANSSGEGVNIRADSVRIRQILHNLVLNASEAIGDEEGEVVLAVDTMERERIVSSPVYPMTWQPTDDAYACISISDTGAGMPGETLEKIFDPFFSTKFIGRGLGLAVVLGIVTAYNGAISVESTPGKGSLFRVFLPLCREEAPRVLKTSAAPSESVQRGGLILLVEDEAELRSMAISMLELLEYEVVTAKDGIEALEVFQEHGRRIRCVVLDITMPRMNGWQTLDALRARRSDLPVILATGHTESDVLQEERRHKAQAILFKPYQLKDMEAALDVALGNDPQAG
ncbi:MAG: FIST N-terminal domain-containing protein [Syntrophobacteraceae bacterium]